MGPSPGGHFIVDDRLSKLTQRMVKAIDESLSTSASISKVIKEFRAEGYDALLVLEATVGFSKRGGGGGGSAQSKVSHQRLDENLTEQDQEFLRSLSITLEN